MSKKVRNNETVGSLDKRLLILENNKWNSWFGKHPGTVIAIVISSLGTSFFFYHTWQIDRMDKNHQLNIASLKKQNQEKIKWLKEQQKIKLDSTKERCSLEKEKINNKLTQCEIVAKNKT